MNLFQEDMNKYFKSVTVSDLLLVLCIILTSIAVYNSLLKNRSKPQAYIYFKNNLIGIYSLGKNQKIKVKENCIVEIRKGKARIIESDCPDKRCVKQGFSNSVPIICLPNQILIEFRSDRVKKSIHIIY